MRDKGKKEKSKNPVPRVLSSRQFSIISASVNDSPFPDDFYKAIIEGDNICTLT